MPQENMFCLLAIDEQVGVPGSEQNTQARACMALNPVHLRYGPECVALLLMRREGCLGRCAATEWLWAEFLSPSMLGNVPGVFVSITPGEVPGQIVAVEGNYGPKDHAQAQHGTAGTAHTRLGSA